MWLLFTSEALILLVLATLRVVPLTAVVIVPTVTLIALSFGAAGTTETLQPLAQRAMRRLRPDMVTDELLCVITVTKETTRANLGRRMHLSDDEVGRSLARGVMFGYVRRALDNTADNGEDMERWRLTAAGKARVAAIVSAAELSHQTIQLEAAPRASSVAAKRIR